ncbi:hypothetical protein [Paenibacillus rigui]|uniref:DUF3953 domain-containing protein n=1 Tax=Paenibacillus rigui TaxID=554312 RepID=A0A229UNL2_9BACL|nr:hypothetical protein [Paenibacillus rigui]OXM84934.1 hypothetical protein CF651_18710 [Paenibacillus rigui]
MGKLSKILGIIASVVTIAIAVSYFMDKPSMDQTRLSCLMLAMCGSLIFNGGASYLTKKDRQGLLSVAVGIVIVVFVLLQYPF